MVRLILTGVLVGWILTAAPAVRAEPPPQTCPPACDGIPAAAWPAPQTLPMASAARWPALPGLAVPVRQPRFFSR